uniref:CARD domain-containing protein n=1 Tax=Callorhinchus milii TaxID=7868 RepID=A0A4W3H8C2_CALMI
MAAESQTPCTRILKQCREFLINYMTEGRLNHILDVLRSQKLLTKASYETIAALNTQTSRTRALLDICLCLGEGAARVVVGLLPEDKKVQVAGRSTCLQCLVNQIFPSWLISSYCTDKTPDH